MIVLKTLYLLYLKKGSWSERVDAADPSSPSTVFRCNFSAIGKKETAVCRRICARLGTCVRICACEKGTECVFLHTWRDACAPYPTPNFQLRVARACGDDQHSHYRGGISRFKMGSRV